MVPQLILSLRFGPISLKIIIMVPQLLLRYSIWSLAVNFNPKCLWCSNLKSGPP